MGREWLYWAGGGGAASTRRGRVNIPAKVKHSQGTTNSSPGCMCAVFQLFDLHPFQISLNHQNLDTHSHEEEEDIASKGVEAPRNSLELDEQPAAINEDEESLTFPAGIQIKARKTEDFASECSSTSPGTKTPSLVARLMGLDLLPECNSPSFSSSNSKPKTKSHFIPRKDRKTRSTNRCFSDDDISVGARSLPVSPRVSSARRSDVEFHRLSLQINKEEQLSGKMVGRKRGRLRHDDNNSSRSPAAHYAKQIVNQIKGTVSRRVGLMDITNTSRPSSDKDEIIRRYQNLVLKKPNSKILGDEISPQGKQSNSPKLRFSDAGKNKLPAPVNSGTSKSQRTSTSSDNHNPNSLKPKINQTIVPEKQQQQNEIRKAGSGGNRTKLHPQARDEAIRNKKDETFVRSSARNKANFTNKKNKKAPLMTNEVLHISGPTLLPVKKDPSPPATKLPQKQSQVSDALSSKRNTQLSSTASQSYKQLPLHGPHKIFTLLPDNSNGCDTTSTAAATAAEYKDYIQRILRRTGIIDRATPLTLGKWHTPSHPLDPSIFYYLELFQPTTATAAVLSRRCDRKLIFQLVDELLAEILRPHFDFKIWGSPGSGIIQDSLADELCKRIDDFPAADCQVLEDIDSLIDKDLQKSKVNGYFEEECERLVCEIEGEILESLVRETVAVAVDWRRTDGGERKRVMGVTWGGVSRDEMPLVGVRGIIHVEKVSSIVRLV